MVVEGSRAIAQVARELGLSETSLGNWVRAYREAPCRRRAAAGIVGAGRGRGN
jgi:transposase-like protein